MLGKIRVCAVFHKLRITLIFVSARQEKYLEIFETNKKMTKWLVENFDELRIDNE